MLKQKQVEMLGKTEEFIQFKHQEIEEINTAIHQEEQQRIFIQNPQLCADFKELKENYAPEIIYSSALYNKIEKEEEKTK